MSCPHHRSSTISANPISPPPSGTTENKSAETKSLLRHMQDRHEAVRVGGGVSVLGGLLGQRSVLVSPHTDCVSVSVSVLVEGQTRCVRGCDISSDAVLCCAVLCGSSPAATATAAAAAAAAADAEPFESLSSSFCFVFFIYFYLLMRLRFSSLQPDQAETDHRLVGDWAAASVLPSCIPEEENETGGILTTKRRCERDSCCLYRVPRVTGSWGSFCPFVAHGGRWE